MARNAHIVNPLTDCPICGATGWLDSRLPGRKKVCPVCGGTGHVNFKGRQQLLAKLKAKERT
jgi:RecJ-like exonuclease